MKMEKKVEREFCKKLYARTRSLGSKSEDYFLGLNIASAGTDTAVVNARSGGVFPP